MSLQLQAGGGDPALATAVVGLVLIAVGVGLAVLGVRELRPELRRLRADPVPVFEAPSARGPVELHGRVAVHEDVLEAPFTGTECVAYRFEVEEYRSGGQYSHWETLAEGGLYAPFRLEDDTGTILVEPSGDDVHFADEWSVEVGRDETVRGRAREFLESLDVEPGEAGEFSIGPIEIGTGDRRRYTEGRLDVGEAVAVYGPVEYDADAGRAGGTGAVNAAVRARDGQALVVGDGAEIPVLRRSTLARGGLVLGGAVLSAFGAFYAAVGLGLAP